MLRTTFNISKMDCPSEERIIRMKLEGLTNIQSLQFDIPSRKLEVCHTDSYDDILAAQSEALINLLDKKGIISKQELLDEMKSVKAKMVKST